MAAHCLDLHQGKDRGACPHKDGWQPESCAIDAGLAYVSCMSGAGRRYGGQVQKRGAFLVCCQPSPLAHRSILNSRPITKHIHPSQWRLSHVCMPCISICAFPRCNYRWLELPQPILQCFSAVASQQRAIADIPSLLDLPPVKPSAIALGTAFNHAVSLAVLGPVFGDAYRRAQQANSKEEYFHTKEAATAAASWGSSIVGSAVQAYGVGALINATGTLTYKGAAYLGSLIFFASAAPSVR